MIISLYYFPFSFVSLTFRLITLTQPVCVQNALIHTFFHLAEQQAKFSEKPGERGKEIGFSIKTHLFQWNLSLQLPMAKLGVGPLGFSHL